MLVVKHWKIFRNSIYSGTNDDSVDYRAFVCNFWLVILSIELETNLYTKKGTMITSIK